MSDEQNWLDLAVEAATENVKAGGGPFGALVVKDGELIATGVNQVTPTLDPTAHAELLALVGLDLVGSVEREHGPGR